MSAPITPTEAHQETATRWFLSRPQNVNRQIDSLAQLIAESEARVADAATTEARKPGNALFAAIVGGIEPYFPKGSRDLEWDVLPMTVTVIAAERDALRRRIKQLEGQK